MTIEQFEQMPDDDLLHELDEGELITMPPNGGMHGLTASRITRLLHGYLDGHSVGRLLPCSVGFILSRSPAVVRCADISFLRMEKMQALPEDGFPDEAPDLTVEVVPSSDPPAALARRIRQFLNAGTHTVWVVHRDTREVHVHEASGTSRFLTADQALEAPDLLPGFSVKVADLFPDPAGGSTRAS